MKLAYADGRKYVADPRYMKAQVKELLSDEYTAKRRALIGEQAIMLGPAIRSAAVRYICVRQTAKAIWFRISKAIFRALAAA